MSQGQGRPSPPATRTPGAIAMVFTGHDGRGGQGDVRAGPIAALKKALPEGYKRRRTEIRRTESGTMRLQGRRRRGQEGRQGSSRSRRRGQERDRQAVKKGPAHKRGPGLRIPANARPSAKTWSLCVCEDLVLYATGDTYRIGTCPPSLTS
ncbi:MAG: hypothetical protein M0C28_40365 [Candidatus Moduliflexus flocculans]|nr:hypothetical protein [Candidatus Moduliflexus flocculans]